ncbi:GDYXXLXY domain-containing protein [Zooshikella marina]|uniref:GDYXXLXY domain-containing protein n=1 Tax=Zooshikella ganghwensis TaxID=202772 RepID=UPI001BAEA179|nr:GDYXXLXY domain-containing protein [Zooshikella ganghwensis]MBU2704509.1 GDYXXLXY domain-containing protein [Zooshikella ganghwensis]
MISPLQRWGIVAGWLLVMVAINWSIIQKEHVLDSGQQVRLALAPVDPRSLMQGDYMRLRYAIVNEVPVHQLAAEGLLIIQLDKQQVASFVGVHQPGKPLKKGELLLHYRRYGEHVKLGAESYLFEEGKASLLSEAAYGEFRVAADGRTVLVGLLDQNFHYLDTLFQE